MQLKCVAPEPENLADSLAAIAANEQSQNPPTPIDRLLPEVLAYIFEVYVKSWNDATPESALVQGPISLAQVCKHWKAIVESDRHIWTSIYFYFPDARHGNCEEDIKRVKSTFNLYLQRSGKLPVSLTYIDDRGYDKRTKGLVYLLVQRLRRHSHRWGRISFRLSYIYFELLFRFLPGDFPSLEHLSFDGDVLGSRDITISTPPQLYLDSAPNLKSFVYTGPAELLDENIIFPWERLAEVSLNFATSSSYSGQLVRLARYQYMTSCTLVMPSSDVGFDDFPITLPCLRTLRICRLSLHSRASRLIDPLVLPHLQALEIDSETVEGLVYWISMWHDHNFSNLLRRSGCSLRRLSIQHVRFPNDEIVRCLALSPELESFRFIPCPRYQDIANLIRALDISAGTAEGGQTGSQQGQDQEHDALEYVTIQDGPLVPELREITLGTSVDSYLGLMMTMIRSRTGPRACAVGVSALGRAEVMFLDAQMLLPDAPEGRSKNTASFRADLARLVSEVENEKNDLGGCATGDGRLDASVAVVKPHE